MIEIALHRVGVMVTSEFDKIFQRLSEILRTHAGNMEIKDESPNRFCLVGGLHPKHNTPMPIAWVEVGKAYVSYHLMPIYGCPKLIDGSSLELRGRMQGKSCFNFKVCDEMLFEELERLTLDGFAAFRKAGFLS